MHSYLENLNQELENEIHELNLEVENPILLYEAIIHLIIAKARELKEFVVKKGFKNEQQEIDFFKRLKPQIAAKLIYYNSIYKIETKKPYGGEKVIKKYLNNELDKIKRFFDNNLDFYKYYRTNSSYLDHKYFLRGKHDIKLSLDTYYFESDQNFSTSHDYKVAKIIAYDLLQVYIEDQLFNPNIGNQLVGNTPLNWTGSKTSLIELIYSFHAQAVFNNGNVDIKILAKSFENMFNIDLGDYYHTFLELRNRKINRTKFLDNLKQSLIRKMDEQDEK